MIGQVGGRERPIRFVAEGKGGSGTHRSRKNAATPRQKPSRAPEGNEYLTGPAIGKEREGEVSHQGALDRGAHSYLLQSSAGNHPRCGALHKKEFGSVRESPQPAGKEQGGNLGSAKGMFAHNGQGEKKKRDPIARSISARSPSKRKKSRREAGKRTFTWHRV